MPSSADRKTIKFGPEKILADLGIEPPAYYDLSTILLGFPKAFSVSYTPNLELPNLRAGYTVARYDGPGHFVWMGVNPSERTAQADRNPQGLFSLDRGKNRVLVTSDQSLPVRDSYIGHANHFGTQLSFSEMLLELEQQGTQFFQVSRSLTHITEAKNKGLIDGETLVNLSSAAGEIFGPRREWKGHGFVIDGPTTAADVIEGKRLDIAKIDFTLPPDAIREQLMKDW